MSESSLPHLLSAYTAQPLACDRRTIELFVRVLRSREAGASFNGPQLHAEMGIASPRTPSSRQRDFRVAIIPIVGVIANRAHSMGASAAQTGALIDAAADDQRTDAIVLDIDSPGGTIAGVPEVAEKVFNARQQKPVVAIANGLMASAAYWIGSAASEVSVTPSGAVGSIGVYTVHIDESKALEKDGYVITEMSAGQYKTEGAPWKPLEEEGRAFLQREVNAAYNWFVRDVARFRGDTATAVRDGYGQGRVLSATDAVRARLADRIETIDQAIERLARGGGRTRGRAHPAAQLAAGRVHRGYSVADEAYARKLKRQRGN